MDRAARNLLALAAIALMLAAYGICGFLAYGVVPLLEGRTASDWIGLLAVAGLGMLLVVSFGRGARALRRQAVATRELSHVIAEAGLTPPPRLRIAARDAGLAGRFTLIDSPEGCSFVYGALMPRVAISSNLLSRLSQEELQAALEHERYHVQRLDPLRGALAGAAVDAMFFLPALRTLCSRYEVARELAADRQAVERAGSRPLAGALLKAMEGAPAEHPATIGLASPELIDRRLAQLEGGPAPQLDAASSGMLGATVLGAFAFLALLAGAPLSIGGGSDVWRELGPASLLEGAALCLLPLAAVAGLIYRRLTIRSAAGM
jgi:Zn-dependent protease with chaperone function